MIFQVGPSTLCMDLAYVRQILDRDTLYPVPLINKAIEGVTYYQESALPVIRPESLVEFVGHKPTSGKADQSDLILVVEWQKYNVGILLDRIESVVDGEKINWDNADLSEAQTIQYDGRELHLLDAERVFTLIKMNLRKNPLEEN